MSTKTRIKENRQGCDYFLDFAVQCPYTHNMERERIEIRLSKAKKAQLWLKAKEMGLKPSLIVRLLINDFIKSDSKCFPVRCSAFGEFHQEARTHKSRFPINHG
jgi:antitoxin component of RelBE/YafQ-DinJ toxin-antitoxin module